MSEAVARPRTWRERVAGLRRGLAARPWLPVAAIALGALALRLWHIDAQSLWLDEGVSVYFAGLGPVRIWQLTFSIEPNPPLYHLLHWAWLSLFGQSEIAVRGLSALAGALCIVPAYALGCALSGRRAGLLAALITAASPYLLWYSQEARAFALLSLLSAILTFLTYSLEQRFTWRKAALWAVVATLVLYTHLYGTFAVAACVLYLLIALPRRWPALVPAMAAPALLYLPWLQVTMAQYNPAANWRASLTMAEMLDRALAAVVHDGTLASRPLALAAVGIVIALALVGLAVRGWRAGLLLGLGVALPLAACCILSLKQPIFSERYIITVAIPLYIAAALGIDALARRLRGAEVVAGVAVLALCVHGVGTFGTPAFSKENYRAAAARVAQTATADDVVLCVAEYAQFPLRYYYPGPARLVGFEGDPANPGPYLEGVLKGARMVWLVESHTEAADPEHRVRQWLAERYPLATEAYPVGMQVRAYTVQSRLAAPPAAARPVDARVGALRLAAVDRPAASPAQDSALHPPSAWLPVTLYWQADQQPAADYRLTVQLVDARGVWGASLERQDDLFHRLPTSRWSVGDTMVESVDVNLNPATPAGTFHLQAQVLDASGQPLPVLDADGRPLGDAIPLGDVEITGPASPLQQAAEWLAGRPRAFVEAAKRLLP